MNTIAQQVNVSVLKNQYKRAKKVDKYLRTLQAKRKPQSTTQRFAKKAFKFGMFAILVATPGTALILSTMH